MCGIAGTMDARLAGADGTAANATFHAEASTAIRTALDVMATRGPDDQGIWSGPGIVLGHRRLAIIDVQGGRQPLTDRETGVVLTFNHTFVTFLAQFSDDLVWPIFLSVLSASVASSQ
jgi:asparagine synthetase B (glutamine-hydrolysing)